MGKAMGALRGGAVGRVRDCVRQSIEQRAQLQWITSDHHCRPSPGTATVMNDLPLSKVYQLLEPGPVVPLPTTRKGCANVMTMSWHMMVEFEPPLVACIVSEANFSFAALRSTGEAVIAIPARGLADKVVEVGNCSGRDNDKFQRFGLTPLPARQIGSPMIKECFCNLECRVRD